MIGGTPEKPTRPALRVRETGPYAAFQDLGRRGYRELGVGRSGAFDLRQHRLANRLVGNAESAASIELVLGGLRLVALTSVTIAVTGAPGPVWCDTRPVATHQALSMPAGTEIRIGVPDHGLRRYVTVRGGFDVPPVLGSRSTDSLSGIGPMPITAGDVLLVGRPPAGPLPANGPAWSRVPDTDATVRIGLGPRDDWFTADAIEALVTARFAVSADCDRVGVRLTGPALTRARPGELAPEPVVLGAVQVPSSGQPIIFGPDHPTTGGYPVIAVVVAADLDLVAQLRPGESVRMVRVGAPRGDRPR
ncbi:MAG: biotin-dependent carboxyltransferase family protein [Nocardioides sp.]